MRYVPIEELMRLSSLIEIEAAEQEIQSINIEEERKKYIEDNSTRWSNLKPSLWNLNNLKCWYSDDIIQETEGEVEHYRPKGNVCKSRHTGYWWLAFNWRNLRLVHSTCNKRRTDYLTKKKAGKGMYFPLKDENKRAYNVADIINEEPVLLDPTIVNDVRLICFNTSTGKPEPSSICNGDPWRTQRVIETIGYYHLDEGSWNKNRFDVAKAVAQLCKKISKTNGDEQDKLIEELKNEYLNEYASFYCVAIQVVKEYGLYAII